MLTVVPWLTAGEIDDLCRPLTQPAAQRRFLATALKLHVTTKKNGRPLVARTELERVLGAARLSRDAQNHMSTGVDIASLRQHLAQRKLDGTQQKRR